MKFTRGGLRAMECNSSIRLQIMLIAVIGGLAFLGYLLVNVVLSAVNASRLDDLQHNQFPVIEDIRLLKQNLTSIREGLAAAIGLGDSMLLEDTAKLAQQARDRLDGLSRRDEDLHRRMIPIRQAFEAYIQPALLLSRGLLGDPGRLPHYKSAMEASLRDYDTLIQQIQDLQHERQTRYGQSLQETNEALNRANILGAGLGVAVILTLVMLAWGISRKVLRQISESDRLKDEFLAIISHELRTPMNGIMGALSLIRGTGLNDEQQHWVDVANRSANGMMMSIDDLLQFSEVSAGKGGSNLAAFRLRGGVEKLLESQQVEFAEKPVKVEFHGGALLDRVIIGNEAKILYVVRHLLNNALKFTERGSVNLSFALASDISGRGEAMIRVLVQDTGPGIPPAKLEQLFRPFRQLDASFSRRHQGMGIGLATCHAIARLLNGELKVRNRNVGGLEVEFVFPAQFADENTELMEQAGIAGSLRAEGRHPVVLVVEDNPVNLMVLKGYLKRLGYGVLSARDGRQALDLMQSKMVDLVLMDCQLPVMDGYEATRAIRALAPPLCDTPVVALTANAMETDRQRCLQSGMNEFLQKPAQLEQLRTTLAAYLEPQSV